MGVFLSLAVICFLVWTGLVIRNKRKKTDIPEPVPPYSFEHLCRGMQSMEYDDIRYAYSKPSIPKPLSVPQPNIEKSDQDVQNVCAQIIFFNNPGE